MQQRLSRFILELYERAQQADPARFHLEAYQSARGLIRFDSAGMISFFPRSDGSLAITSVLPFESHPDKPALRAELVGEERYDPQHGYRGPDPLLAKALSQQGQAHVLPCAALKDPGVQEYTRRSDTAQAAAMAFTHASGRVDVCSMWRATHKAVFTARDQSMVGLITSHLRQAITLNRRMRGSTLEELGGENQIIADRSGLIRHIDDGALLLLRREYPGWLSSLLPIELVSALTASAAQRHIGKHIEVSLRPLAELIRLELRPRAAGERLTQAELRVVDMIVRHGNYKAAARAIGVSPATIRNQLHVIYRKLGIRSKVELVRQFSRPH